MAYRAHRDERFEYAEDVIRFIEKRQCGSCRFKQKGGDDVMCADIAVAITLEEKVKCLDDLGDKGVVCRKYEKDTHVGTRKTSGAVD